MKISEAQQQLLNLIREVEEGVSTPDQVFPRFVALKAECPNFKPDYTLEDFGAIYTAAQSTYEESEEPNYETSYYESSY